MIAVQLEGQLGNQMFQTAFIRSASKRLKTLYFIQKDKAWGNQVAVWFRVPWMESRLFGKICRWMRTDRNLAHSEYSNWQDPADVIDNLRNNTLYNGFFQSAVYFNKRDAVFKIRKKYRTLFEKQYPEFRHGEDYIVVHIRLGDYKEFGNDRLGGKGMTLPLAYYYEALREADPEMNKKVFVISDDPASARKYFLPGRKISYAENSAIIDLQLMIHAQTLILSCSSFSWWGAWLNNHPRRRVIAPEYWLGFKVKKTYPAGIVLPEWINLSVPLN